MATVKINLDTNSSKVEEIETLKQIANAVSGTQTYLASLFTQDLINWVAEMVKQDFSPDIMDNYRDVQKSLMAAEAAKNAAEMSLRNTEERIAYNQGLIENAKFEIASLKAEVTRLNNLVDTKTFEVQNAERFSAAVEDKAEQLEAKIAALKVRIYDLEHGE